MAKALQFKNNLLFSFTTNWTTNIVKSAVHDGDTINVSLDGDFGVRFLAIDTPEVSFNLPGSTFFTSISSNKWKTFLTDPFAAQYGNFSRIELDGITKTEGNAQNILGTDLVNYLQNKAGSKCAENHVAHADNAHRQLEDIIRTHIIERDQQGQPYRIFLAFSYTQVDRYGRLLAYVHRDEKPQERGPSYNERMLSEGYAAPYFIWPNIDPFRIKPNQRAAVPRPDQLLNWLTTGDGKRLDRARQAVRAVRQDEKGIFGPTDNQGPLALLPFELRYLAGRRAPDRYLLDLSQAGTSSAGIILRPTSYYSVQNLEDRLFIEADDLCLFLNRGYVLV